MEKTDIFNKVAGLEYKDNANDKSGCDVILS